MSEPDHPPPSEMAHSIHARLDMLQTSLEEDGADTEWRDQVLGSVKQMATELGEGLERSESRCRKLERTVLKCQNAPRWFEHHAYRLIESVSHHLHHERQKLNHAREKAVQFRQQYEASLESLERELQLREEELGLAAGQHESTAAQLSEMDTALSKLCLLYTSPSPRDS
eukprot:TRINITY_DN28881_c0_g1_i2.p1 TRINITY_DN28881_c0_g1~~TRINITY_DN28881_c0_g1_i2.p1  ORF type:complete len:170 (-),score=53.76 TRINITY_DN28881_c0_g1_i2:111-620(-)